jgi:tetratricopeptide (TPR) repeat protein
VKGWVLVALAAVAGLTCMAEPPEPPASAWMEAVARSNDEADRLIDRGDPLAARRVLASVLASAPDGSGAGTSATGPARAEARRVLLQDTYFRLARLELDAREPAAAASHAGQGLALGGRDDLFVANLLVARGAAREALGQTAAALADYDRALRINETLLHETLSTP